MILNAVSQETNVTYTNTNLNIPPIVTDGFFETDENSPLIVNFPYNVTFYQTAVIHITSLPLHGTLIQYSALVSSFMAGTFYFAPDLVSDPQNRVWYVKIIIIMVFTLIGMYQTNISMAPTVLSFMLLMDRLILQQHILYI